MTFSEVTKEIIDNLIINAIMTLREKHKRPDEFSIADTLNITKETDKKTLTEKIRRSYKE